MTTKVTALMAAAMVVIAGFPLPTAAQTLTEADIAWMQIIAVNRYEGMFRHARGEGAGRIDVNVTITLGPAGEVTWRSTRNVAAETPKGTKHALLTRSGRPGHTKPGGSPVQSASTAVSKVHSNPDGLGTAVWSFDNGALVRLSVETEGTKGRTFFITFSEDLRTCAFKVDEVGQVGAGAKSWVNRNGKKRWLVALVSQSTTYKLRN